MEDEDRIEVVDALPVLADDEPAEPLPAPSRSFLPASPVTVTAAAVAATGFVAGAATFALAARRRSRPRRPVAPRGMQISGTRSYLVDVHVLEPRR